MSLPGNELVKMTVDGDLVRAVVEKQVTAAIAAQFNKVPELVEKIVSLALNTKVNREGGVSQYSSDNRYDYIEVLCHKAIREQATAIVKQWILDNQPQVKKAVEKHLHSQKTEFVKRLVAAVDSAISPSFYVNCTLKLQE